MGFPIYKNKTSQKTAEMSRDRIQGKSGDQFSRREKRKGQKHTREQMSFWLVKDKEQRKTEMLVMNDKGQLEQ